VMEDTECEFLVTKLVSAASDGMMIMSCNSLHLTGSSRGPSQPYCFVFVFVRSKHIFFLQTPVFDK